MSEHKDSISRKDMMVVVVLTLIGLAVAHFVVGETLLPGTSFGVLSLLGAAIGVAAFFVYLGTRKKAG